jgi:hypothetical protein
MSSTSQTLKRLGVGTVTVATVLAMPYVGVASALAAAPVAGTPATIAIASQAGGFASTRNDGTNVTVKISATVTPPGTGSDAIAAVRFSATSAVVGSAPVVIGTDSTAPFSVEWAPTAGGVYTETAEALNAAGTSATQPATVGDLSSVHITSPVEGALIGSFGGKIIVSGTRSSDLPALAITASSRDNSNGALVAGATNNTVTQGAPAAGADQTWTASVAVPACANTVTAGDCDVVISAVASNIGTSDEVTEAKLYAQTLTNYTLAPTSANQPVGAAVPFKVTATDQSGKPIAGAPVNVTTSHATAVPSAASGVTGTDGTFAFTVTDSVAETTTVTASSGNNPATDFTRTATLTTYTSTPTTLSFSVTPAKPVYATDGGGAADEYTNTVPTVDLCIVDQNSNGTPAGTPPTNLVVTVTRNSTTGGTAATPITTPATLTVDPATGKTNCYIVTHADSGAVDFGSDTFNAYFESNGTPGAQAGEAAATPLTTKFATLAITGNNTQSQVATTVTVPFTVTGADGSVFANRKILLTTTGTFPTTQPTGTTYTSATSAVGITDANGVVKVSVSSNTVGGVTVTATDTTDATRNQVSTGKSKTVTVDFRTASVALNAVQTVSNTVLSPSASPNTSGTARPGDVRKVKYQLNDASPALLAGVSTTLTLDHGFFTPACGSSTYEQCTFDPAAAASAPAGNLKSLGKSMTVTSDNSGQFTVYIAVGRDAAFDTAGTVNATVSATAGGVTKTATPLTFSTDGLNNTGVDPINGAAVKFVARTATDKISGDVQLPNGSVFVVRLTDQFGNLVKTAHCSTVIAVTGGGVVKNVPNNDCNDTTADGSFLANGSNDDYYTLKSATTSTSGQSNTVTANWPAPVTTFVAPVVAGGPFTTAASTSNKTDSFTVNLYQIDQTALTYTPVSTPGTTVPVNTAVTTSVTVKDQKGNPVQNLCVHFLRSGPGSQSGEGGANDIFGQCTLQTNAQGRAGYLYSSTTPGVATITYIVGDTSGNELSRGVTNETFTSGSPATTTSISADVGTIFAGRMAFLTVHGTPNANYDVFAANRPSSTFVIAHQGKLDANGNSLAFEVHPLNNVVFTATVGSATSNNQINLAVHTLLNFSAHRKAGANAHTYVFSGQIYPANRSQAIFIKIGNTTLGQATRSPGASGKNWTFTYDGSSKAGQRVVLYSATASDTQNANGHSANFSLKL